MTDIQRKINEAMESVQNINRATPNPFFYTRLEARLMRDEKNVWEKLSRVITRPAVAFFTVSVILMLNIFVVVNGASRLNDQPDRSEMAFGEDLGTTSFYDIENIQP